MLGAGWGGTVVTVLGGTVITVVGGTVVTVVGGTVVTVVIYTASGGMHPWSLLWWWEALNPIKPGNYWSAE